MPRAIAEEVRTTVTTDSARRPARSRAVNPEAYNGYLLGRDHWRQRSPQSLEKAIQNPRPRSPRIRTSPPRMKVWRRPTVLGSSTATPLPVAGQVEMKAAALKALELDPGLGEARAVLAAALAASGTGTVRSANTGRHRDRPERDRCLPSRTAAYLYALGQLRGEPRRRLGRRSSWTRLDVTVNACPGPRLDASGQDEAALAQWNRTLELLDPDHLRSTSSRLFLLEHGHARARPASSSSAPAPCNRTIRRSARAASPSCRRRAARRPGPPPSSRS